jgi:hypothetical protein
MSLDDDETSDFVCHGCIGDAYLKAKIKSESERHECMICGKQKGAMSFDELCDRIHKIIEAEFRSTASEPDSWAMYKDGEIEWVRKGEPVDSILYEILECDQPLIEALKERLSDLHYSFDDAASGEENPYGDDVRYESCMSHGEKYYDVWSLFQTEIRTRARFFSRTAESLLDSIFGELNRFRTHKRELIRDAGPGTATQWIFRARRAFTNQEIARIVEHPARELGPPPSRSTDSGRMNPKWISMFYGALDPDTCVAEIRAPVGSAAVIGKFQIIRPLRLLDLGAFQHLFVDRASYFDPDFRGLSDRAEFLKRLVGIMSRPVMPNEEDFQYLPTQAVAEYLSEKIEPKLDGLIFPSSQRDGEGENVVVFRRASGVEADGSDDLELSTDFGWATDDDSDSSITVWIKPKKPSLEQPKYSDSLFLEVPRETKIASTEGPALRLDLGAIEVRDVRAIGYRTETRRVQRYGEPERSLF